MKKYDSWIVAAAILLDHQQWGLTYKILAREIVASGLTTLGEKGSSPEQTVGSMLRKKADVFEKLGGGYYKLKNPAQVSKWDDIKEAIRALKA